MRVNFPNLTLKIKCAGKLPDLTLKVNVWLSFPSLNLNMCGQFPMFGKKIKKNESNSRL